ncbi:DUF4181 domain-containing protein [Alkalihalobacillus sp. CinArs1]|uniref:DUF4181 domain-containing protein n=1 Tax=Alkalihalobacillus sp. CinArs1 TaxID=2995314 RepID=UPI0022DD0090|nr:DUF4181 domain-containing protein [Alkalihalobacillus sp. CinArs1]
MEPYFWLKLLIVLIILVFLITSFNAIMRRLLKVEKKKLYSNTIVNGTHKKVDRVMRGVAIVLILFGTFYNITRAREEWVWFLEPWFLLILLIIISESFTAYMEWKYAANRKDYLFTISQLIFLIFVMVSAFYSDFFWLL